MEAPVSWYADGVVHLSLPDGSTADGGLRRLLLGAALGLRADEAGLLIDRLLPRIVAHELGPWLRERRRESDPDPVREEQGADDEAERLARPLLPVAHRVEARALLTRALPTLGCLAEAAALHRDRRAAALAGPADPPAVARIADAFRSGSARLRVQAAWTWLDLALDPDLPPVPQVPLA